MRRMISFRDFDWVLLGFVLLICVLGITEIYSTTLGTKFAGAHVKQIYWVLAGITLMFIVSMINYQGLLGNAQWFFLASGLFLVAVAVFGRKDLGRRG